MVTSVVKPAIQINVFVSEQGYCELGKHFTANFVIKRVGVKSRCIYIRKYPSHIFHLKVSKKFNKSVT